MELIFDDRALVLRDGETAVLVVADIHAGYEIELDERVGISIPSQLGRMSKRIRSLSDKHHINHLYFIGDLKHSIGVDRAYNWREIPTFLDEISESVRVSIVPGNHDGDLIPLIPRQIEILDVRGEVIDLDEGAVGLIHGHAWPSSKTLEADMIIMGHNHPVVRRLKHVPASGGGRQQRVRVSHNIPVVLRMEVERDCIRRAQGMLEMGDGRVPLIVLPCFNELLSGVDIGMSDIKLRGPIFERNCAAINDSEIYSTDGLFLGPINVFQHESRNGR